ncbi:DNA primase [Paenibacillus sp. JSM ZJ436]|uniref:DNA primase n=1 Tax=Paenibacillus sp. JSM ZJ436 TaxID=3376190 RepID=UPI0037AB472A
MSNDLQKIKKRILEDDGVRVLLEAMECSYIDKKNNRYEAQLPQKFDSPNKRSVQVYLNESLSSRIRTLGESDIDIYGLVSYIVNDKHTESERQKDLFKAKRWICDTLGYTEYTNQSYTAPPVMEHLKWLKDVKKQRKRKRELSDLENQTYDDSVLEQYVMLPHQKYIDEGVLYETQLEFQIGFDIRSQRIIFPIHNRYGDIVSIKGRTIYDDYEQRDVYKFLYLYNFNKMIELFNWHRALYYIIEKKEIVIVEGEKTVMMLSQWDCRNCVSISGDDLSEWQVNMIRELGADIQIVIALDKDKTINDIKKQAAKFGKTRSVYALWDKDHLYEDRDSPCDKGQDTFSTLYNNYRFRVPV